MSTRASRAVRFEDIACLGCGSLDRTAEVVVSTTDYLTHLPQRYTVQRCARCGLAYSSPRPIFSDLLEYYYLDDYVCYTPKRRIADWRETLKYRGRAQSTISYLGKGPLRVLDVGCGTGRFLQYLKGTLGWEVVGCEPNVKMAAAVEESGISVRAALLDQADFRDAEFDVVFMSHVLEHNPDPKRTLSEVRRILRPGGVFLSEQPNFDAAMRTVFGEHWWGYHLPRHLVHFDPATLKSMIERVGMEWVSCRSCVRPACSPWSFQILLERKGVAPWIARLVGGSSLVAALTFLPIELVLAVARKSDAFEIVCRRPAGSA